MQQMQPALPRYELEQTPNGLSIVVPARRNLFVIVFLCAWLGGWAIGETSALSSLFNNETNRAGGFLSFWLIGWTLAGAWAVTTVLWQLFGKELITLTPGTLNHRVKILGFGRTRSFATSHITRLRAVDVVAPTFLRQRAYMPPFFREGDGPLVFDYGAKTIRMGQSLDEAEAHQLLARLNALLPLSAREERANF